MKYLPTLSYVLTWSDERNWEQMADLPTPLLPSMTTLYTGISHPALHGEAGLLVLGLQESPRDPPLDPPRQLPCGENCPDPDLSRLEIK